MIQRAIFVSAVLWTGSSVAQPANYDRNVLTYADSGSVSDAAERQKRREAMRAALRAQSDEPLLAPPKPRSEQERAELREQLRRQRGEPAPASP